MVPAGRPGRRAGGGRRWAVGAGAERRHGCEQCGKAFAQAGALAKHRRVHTGEKPYRCPVCAKAFALSSGLVLHKRTHTGERPHACPLCGKLFGRASHLATHRRRPYKCDRCGKRFRSSAHLWFNFHAAPASLQSVLPNGILSLSQGSMQTLLWGAADL
uniref:C2H2-type domain-containing protein n=1 Tax=Otus sunia TaxID=257818 RepID=A0A8C8B5Z8_9STRI